MAAVKLKASDVRRLGPRVRRAIGPAGATVSTWRRLWSGKLDRLRLKPEEKLAIEVMDYLRTHLPADCLAFHLSQEAQRSRASWAVQQAMGFIRGVPDVMILDEGFRVHGGKIAPTTYFIELKADTLLSDAQREFRDWCQDHGIPFAVVRSLDALQALLGEWRLLD